MENLRWILIFAGVAILVLLYLSGRSGGGRSKGAKAVAPQRGKRDSHVRSRGVEFDTGSRARGPDPLLGEDETGGFDVFGDIEPGDFERPATARARRVRSEPVLAAEYGVHDEDALGAEAYGGGVRGGDAFGTGGYAGDGQEVHELEEETSESEPDRGQRPDESRGEARDQAPARASSGGAFGSFSNKIESIGARLSSRRRERIEASEPDGVEEAEPSDTGPNKIVTLHVAATDGGYFDARSLVAAFERHDFAYGQMSVFHSMHHGKAVFSIVKMVKPGIFDPHDIDSFATPGISLVLQLPGPVPADTAFEVLLSEAFELARELGGVVLDEDRSTLSKQTAQHMREGIYEYMHRQKYFGSVAS